MEKSNQKKYWLSVTATIVLGALGSGLWNLIEPYVGKIGNWILSIATLGIKSIQDDVYANAALGLHELSSLYLLLITSTFMFALPATLTAFPLLLPFLKISVDKEVSVSKDKMESKIKNSLKLLVVAGLFGTLFGSYFFVKFLMVNQENLIASFFRQRVTIIRPYISDHDFNKYNSKFSRIKTKNEYLELMEGMEGVGKAIGVEVPKVETW